MYWHKLSCNARCWMEKIWFSCLEVLQTFLFSELELTLRLLIYKHIVCFINIPHAICNNIIEYSLSYHKNLPEILFEHAMCRRNHKCSTWSCDKKKPLSMFCKFLLYVKIDNTNLIKKLCRLKILGLIKWEIHLQ